MGPGFLVYSVGMGKTSKLPFTSKNPALAAKKDSDGKVVGMNLIDVPIGSVLARQGEKLTLIGPLVQ